MASVLLWRGSIGLQPSRSNDPDPTKPRRSSVGLMTNERESWFGTTPAERGNLNGYPGIHTEHRGRVTLTGSFHMILNTILSAMESVRCTAGKAIADFGSRILERQSIDQCMVSPNIASRSSSTVAPVNDNANSERVQKHHNF